MKTKLMSIFILVPAVILSNGFMVREKEEKIDFSNNYYTIQRNNCFSGFISNLQTMEALIFVPEDKIAEAQKSNLTLNSTGQSKAANRKLVNLSNEYVQVYPSGNKGDACSKAISLGFEDLEIVCFVRKEKAIELGDQVQIKGNQGDFYIKINGTGKGIASKAEELQIKIGTAASWQNFVPVMNQTNR
ncbi:MAG: hypothetical protein LLG13_00595 [Bacteroidales bacterium]|nr:hypothetical protein [Bacteroidales bacterium]